MYLAPRSQGWFYLSHDKGDMLALRPTADKAPLGTRGRNERKHGARSAPVSTFHFLFSRPRLPIHRSYGADDSEEAHHPAQPALGERLPVPPEGDVQRGLLPDLVVRQRAAAEVVQGLAAQDEVVALRADARPVLDVRLDIGDGVGGVNLEGRAAYTSQSPSAQLESSTWEHLRHG